MLRTCIRNQGCRLHCSCHPFQAFNTTEHSQSVSIPGDESDNTSTIAEKLDPECKQEARSFRRGPANNQTRIPSPMPLQRQWHNVRPIRRGIPPLVSPQPNEFHPLQKIGNSSHHDLLRLRHNSHFIRLLRMR
jgi:hypothetical protein